METRPKSETRLKFSATIETINEELGSKKRSDGTTSDVQNCRAKITQEGPLKGMIVIATRTLENQKGEKHNPVKVGDEVVLYHTALPDRSNPNKMMNFFEISTTTSQDDITAALQGMLVEGQVF